MLLNLLAIIHRDGGHYQVEHGTRKAVADACKEWQRLISIVEKTVLTEPKQSLSQLRPIAEAGEVPEGCVRHYTYKQDGEWTPATKHRAMQVTHYIDIPHLPAPAEKPNPKPVEPLATKPISLPLAECMSLRDYFAGQALAGSDISTVMAEALKAGATSDEFSQILSMSVYKIADAMLKAREVKP